MEVIIKGDTKEIAALVVALQERHIQNVKLTIDGKELSELITAHQKNHA